MTPDRSETDSKGETQYFYSSETIRKWLLEDMSDEMMARLGPAWYLQAETYRDLIAAKLEELK